jgi:hypothetical protein
MLQERGDEGKVELFWEETRKQLMDMGTKCLAKRQHKYLRDMSNGYAALRQRYGREGFRISECDEYRRRCRSRGPEHNDDVYEEIDVGRRT